MVGERDREPRPTVPTRPNRRSDEPTPTSHEGDEPGSSGGVAEWSNAPARWIEDGAPVPDTHGLGEHRVAERAAARFALATAG